MTINFLSSTTITQGATPVVALQSEQFGLKQSVIPAFAAYNANAAATGTVVTWGS